MDHHEIITWLRETDATRLEELWRRADRVRQEHVGGDVHLRGLIELSNYCVRTCHYCGLRAPNTKLERYRMSEDEVMEAAHEAVSLGYGTVVLQSGEDPGIEAEWMGRLVRRIKSETPLAVTLSLGERSDEELAAWREAGADRYLLRFETGNRALYERIHPPRPTGQKGTVPFLWHPATKIGTVPGSRTDRIAILQTLRRLGYEVGSGVMIGIPGQSCDDLARDILLFGELDLDMIGVGPYLVHPDTPLADQASWDALPEEEQVPNDELTAYKVIALARLVCPRANIPCTTAVATLNRESGRELGLVRGANVIMPNVTPPRYRALYEIYPDKACIRETAVQCGQCLRGRIQSIGRSVATGRGDSPRYHDRAGMTGEWEPSR